MGRIIPCMENKTCLKPPTSYNRQWQWLSVLPTALALMLREFHISHWPKPRPRKPLRLGSMWNSLNLPCTSSPFHFLPILYGVFETWTRDVHRCYHGSKAPCSSPLHYGWALGALGTLGALRTATPVGCGHRVASKPEIYGCMLCSEVEDSLAAPTLGFLHC